MRHNRTMPVIKHTYVEVSPGHFVFIGYASETQNVTLAFYNADNPVDTNTTIITLSKLAWVNLSLLLQELSRIGEYKAA